MDYFPINTFALKQTNGKLIHIERFYVKTKIIKLYGKYFNDSFFSWLFKLITNNWYQPRNRNIVEITKERAKW